MTDQSQLDQRVTQLEKDYADLSGKTTIPRTVEQAFNARGFLQEASLIVSGNAEIAVLGDFTLIIPSATATSVVMITASNGASGFIQGNMRPSTTYVGQYEIYAQGNAGDPFVFMVFNIKQQPFVTA